MADNHRRPWPSLLPFLLALTLLWIPFSTALTNLLAACFTVCYLLIGPWRRLPLVVARPWFTPLLLLIAANLLGLLWTEDMERGLELISKLKFALLALLGATLPWTVTDLKRLIGFFVGGWTLNLGVGIAQWFGMFPWRAMPWGVEPTGYAGHGILSLSLGVILLWFAFDFKHRFLLPRPFLILTAPLLLLQLALSGGRVGLIAFALLLPPALWLLYPTRKRWALGGAGMVIALLVATPYVQLRLQQALANVEAYRAGNAETAVGFRLLMWEGALQMAGKAPLTGVGTGDYGLEMQHLQAQGRLPETPNAGPYQDPHSMYFAYLANLGLPGLAVLGWFLLGILREGWSARETPGGWFKLAWTATWSIGGLSGTVLWDHHPSLILFIVMAAPSVVQEVPLPVPLLHGGRNNNAPTLR